MRAIAEWSVLDCSNPSAWIARIGITIPKPKGVICMDKEKGYRFVCTRIEGHGGRHAARLSKGELVAVWR